MVTFTKEAVLRILDDVKDPEIPVISVRELGIVRDVEVKQEEVTVTISPTYSGCPAMDVIPAMIREALIEAGYTHTVVHTTLSPPWTTEWITESGKEKLKAFGIAPPDVRHGSEPKHVDCPRCGSSKTEIVSHFGSTPCKAAWRCKSCLEPFDYFKCL